MADESSANTVGIEALATITHYGVRHIQQLARTERPDGKGMVVVRVGRNQYDFLRTIEGIILHIRGLADEVDHSKEAQHEKVRLLSAQRKRHEIAAAVIQGDLVSFDETMERFVNFATLFVSDLEALPGRLTPDMARETSPDIIHDKIRDEVRQVRANVFGRIEDARGAIRAGGNRKTAPKAHPRLVGRPN